MKNLFKVFAIGNRYSAAILALRIVAGLGLMFHGWKKINDPFGWMGEENATPAILQALAAFSEFGGGFCLIVGLLVPLASFGILCTMAVAAFKHIAKGDPFVGKGSYELALIYFCIAILLLLVGTGKYSLDKQIFGEKQP